MIEGLNCNWDDYELIDSGNFEKLERFGSYFLIRPEPQAVWSRSLEYSQWNKISNAIFIQKGSHSGEWKILKSMPDSWEVKYSGLNELGISKNIIFKLALTAFKHVGIFPEQANNWFFIARQCKKWKSIYLNNEVKVLNIFAYTGGASLAACAAGAKVTHVDSVKQILNWANENRKRSNLDDIRWILDDALKFVKKESHRNNKYHGLILDPPSFGRGPTGELWKLENQIDELIFYVSKLLITPENDSKTLNSFLIFNCYSLGFSALLLEGLLRTHLPEQMKDKIQPGEFYFEEKHGKRKLPAGVFARIES